MQPIQPKVLQENQDTLTRDICQGDWITVSFSKNKAITTRSTPPSKATTSGINARIFDADTGKFLNTQKLRYIENEAFDHSNPDNKIKQSTWRIGNPPSKQAL